MKKIISSFLFANIALAAPLTPIDRANVQTFGSIQRVEPPKKFIAMHRAPYKGTIDINYSPYAGGEDLLSATRIAEWTERYLLDLTPMSGSKTGYARTWRLSELFAIWLPANYFAMVVQHEVFGHGYRIRDINSGLARVKGYQIGTPPPYGWGGGATEFLINERISTTQLNTISSGGVESTAILAQITKLKWLESGYIDPRQSILYLLGQQDLTMYIGSLNSLDDENLDGHDIHGYIETLNLTYTNQFLTRDRLRALSWISYADPFTFYSIYALFHYISSGKESTIPMIPIWGAKYLPGVRLGLTPFGPEIFLDNYLVKGGRPIYFYLKGGRHSDNTYCGLGFYAPRIAVLRKWAFGARFDAWRQPKLLLYPGRLTVEEIDFDESPDKENPLYSYSEQHEMKSGAAASAIVFLKGSPRYGFEGELGYKTIGFLPGYSLKTSPVARFSFTLVF